VRENHSCSIRDKCREILKLNSGAHRAQRLYRGMNRTASNGEHAGHDRRRFRSSSGVTKRDRPAVLKTFGKDLT
jgi:hypothetical protein